MSIYEVGRLCIKTAGRDAGNYAVVVEQIDDRHVLIDGGVRRRKVNIRHLEPTAAIVSISRGAPHEGVAKELQKLNLKVWQTKPKAAAPHPVQKRAGKKASAKEAAETGEEKKPKEKLPVKSRVKREITGESS